MEAKMMEDKTDEGKSDGRGKIDGWRMKVVEDKIDGGLVLHRFGPPSLWSFISLILHQFGPPSVSSSISLVFHHFCPPSVFSSIDLVLPPVFPPSIEENNKKSFIILASIRISAIK